MRFRWSWLITLLWSSGFAHGQLPVLRIPAGTPLPVEIHQHMPMRVGTTIHAELIYSVYVDNRLVLPARTAVTGIVTALRPNHARRVTARLRADFTPFDVPVVRFNSITLADGEVLPLSTGTATDGAPIYRLVAPPPPKGGFLHQEFEKGLQMARDRVAVITGPNKRDRLVQFLYTQLPYHPQRVEKGTAWTVQTTEPLVLPARAVGAQQTAAEPPPGLIQQDPAKPWILRAYLDEGLSSATSKQGEIIRATVAEPIYNRDRTIAVPQSATLVGEVTQAKPARMFGRAGALHFTFRQLVLPAGVQNVQATLTGADSAAGQSLALDAEGQVKPQPKDKLLVPFTLLVLAARRWMRIAGMAQAQALAKMQSLPIA